MKREFLGYLWTKSDIMMPDPFQRVDRITRHYSLEKMGGENIQNW